MLSEVQKVDIWMQGKRDLWIDKQYIDYEISLVTCFWELGSCEYGVLMAYF
jgi:hypothetical protein